MPSKAKPVSRGGEKERGNTSSPDVAGLAGFQEDIKGLKLMIPIGLVSQGSVHLSGILDRMCHAAEERKVTQASKHRFGEFGREQQKCVFEDERP
jgi:hypothetical protein